MLDRDPAFPASSAVVPRVRVVAVAQHRDIDEVSRRGIPRDLGVNVRQIDPFINPVPDPVFAGIGNFHPRDPAAGTRSQFARLAARGRWIRTCMGLSLSSGVFRFIASSLFGAGKPFFIPSPTVRFPERAEGVKGPKR